MSWVIIWTSLKQLWGMIVIEYRYKGKLPDKDSFTGSISYSLPFSGEWTVANGGVTPETSHSWEIPTQRYAYDFVILDQEGKTFRGDETLPDSFYCYGRDVLAPADGTVAQVGNGSQDSLITPQRNASCASRNICGNYIVIRHGESEYSLLAHLKPDSILVREGQPVRRGERIAQCGNTGNSSEPHLHFQIQNGKSFFNSVGLPVRFEAIHVRNHPNYKEFDDREVPAGEDKYYPPYITRGQAVSSLEKE